MQSAAPLSKNIALDPSCNASYRITIKYAPNDINRNRYCFIVASVYYKYVEHNGFLRKRRELITPGRIVGSKFESC